MIRLCIRVKYLHRGTRGRCGKNQVQQIWDSVLEFFPPQIYKLYCFGAARPLLIC